MKIKNKQLIILSIISLSLIITLVISVSLLQRFQQIQNEKEKLLHLSLEAHETLSEISLLIMNGSLNDLGVKIDENQERLKRAFQDVDDLRMLPRINQELERAIISILNLESLTLEYLSNLELPNRVLLQNQDNLNVVDLTSAGSISQEQQDLHRYLINEISQKYSLFYSSMDYTTKKIDTQISLINEVLNKALQKNTRFAFILTGIIIILTLIISIRFSSVLSKDIKAISRKLFQMLYSSDPIEIDVKRNDELGSLSHNMEKIFKELLNMRTGLEELVEERTEELSREVSQRKSAEEDLTFTLKSMGDGFIATDIQGRITRMNSLAEELTGYQLNEALGKPLAEILSLEISSTGKVIPDPFGDLIKGEKKSTSDENVRFVNRRGEKIHISISAAPILYNDNTILGVVLVFRDITENYKLKKQLEHSQKMDAIGKLAGGVAHDFNNMLGGILNAAELLQPFVESNEEALKYQSLIIESSVRAASLTSQLLTFARKEPFSSSVIDLHDLIEDTKILLGRTIDKRIKLETRLNAPVSTFTGDSSMMQNVLLNLCINACHAMKEEGLLIISTAHLYLDQGYCDNSPSEIKPGKYIHLTVEDEGEGISRNNLSRIFEPFFTTKEKGKGTGMGLASVYGAISQHKGEITVESEPNIGTIFHVYLPLGNN